MASGRSVFRSPVVGTLFLAIPGLLLVGAAFYAANFRLDHVVSNLAAHPILILVPTFVGAVLVILAAATLFRATREGDAGQPRKSWALLPLVASLPFIALAGVAVRNAQFFQTDVTDVRILQQLQSEDLGGSDQPPPIAGQWAQWRGPHRNGLSGEKGLNMDWDRSPPKELWKHPIRGGYSSMAIADGKLYATDRDHNAERVLCLNATTGEELWVHRYDADYNRVQYPAGPRATPTVHDGRVYTVGATGILLCLEAAPTQSQPKVLWRRDLMREYDAKVPQWGVACSPLIEGDLVIVQPGGNDGSIAAFDRRTGEPAWAALDDVSGYSSPVAGTLAGVRQIVCFTGRGLAGLRPDDGEQLWYYSWKALHDANIATPIIAGDYVFISTGYNKGCALLKVTAGQLGGIEAKPVYVRLRDELMQNHHATCVLYDSHLYGYDEGNHTWKCIDLRTAQQKWASSGLGKGCAIYADGHLIVLCESGELAAVEATPTSARIKGRIQALPRPRDSDVWALPALADGRLYLRDGKHIVCFDLRK